MSYRIVLGVTLSAVIGGAVSTGSLAGFAMSVFLPAFWTRQRSSWMCFWCAAVYYLVTLRAVVVVSRNFLGSGAGLLEGVLLWSVAGFALASPWKVVWSKSALSQLWRVPLGLLTSIVPPLGLIGFASPAAAAGIWFPASGYLGFAGTLMLSGCVAVFPKKTAFVAGVLALSANLLYRGSPGTPRGWQGIDTHFGGIAHGRVDFVNEHQIAENIKAQALGTSARVVVFPESVLPHWTEASDLFWSDTTDMLRAAGKTVVIGAIKRTAGPEPDQLATALAQMADADQRGPVHKQSKESAAETYTNAIIVRGVSSADFVQRVPVPIGMWHPFTNSGAKLRLSSPGTVRIYDQRAAILVCYEQLIPWPALTAFIEQPTAIIAVSNQFWVADTAIPAAQQNTVRAWARLFNVPTVFASNR